MYGIIRDIGLMARLHVSSVQNTMCFVAGAKLHYSSLPAGVRV